MPPYEAGNRGDVGSHRSLWVLYYSFAQLVIQSFNMVVCAESLKVNSQTFLHSILMRSGDDGGTRDSIHFYVTQINCEVNVCIRRQSSHHDPFFYYHIC